MNIATPHSPQPAPSTSIGTIIGGIAGSIADGFARLRHANGPDLDPSAAVAHVELERYAGRWYELARLPVRFQDPRSVSTADYQLNPDGSVKVVNSAWRGNAVQDTITGAARPVPGANNARLRVGFGGLLKLIPTPRQGNYWVLDLAPDYSLALVGDPTHRNLWLLGRDQNAFGTAAAQAMLGHAQQLGYDLSRLQRDDWTRGETVPSPIAPHAQV